MKVENVSSAENENFVERGSSSNSTWILQYEVRRQKIQPEIPAKNSNLSHVDVFEFLYLIGPIVNGSKFDIKKVIGSNKLLLLMPNEGITTEASISTIVESTELPKYSKTKSMSQQEEKPKSFGAILGSILKQNSSSPSGVSKKANDPQSHSLFLREYGVPLTEYKAPVRPTSATITATFDTVFPSVETLPIAATITTNVPNTLSVSSTAEVSTNISNFTSTFLTSERSSQPSLLSAEWPLPSTTDPITVTTTSADDASGTYTSMGSTQFQTDTTTGDVTSKAYAKGDADVTTLNGDLAATVTLTIPAIPYDHDANITFVSEAETVTTILTPTVPVIPDDYDADITVNLTDLMPVSYRQKKPALDPTKTIFNSFTNEVTTTAATVGESASFTPTTTLATTSTKPGKEASPAPGKGVIDQAEPSRIQISKQNDSFWTSSGSGPVISLNGIVSSAINVAPDGTKDHLTSISFPEVSLNSSASASATINARNVTLIFVRTDFAFNVSLKNFEAATTLGSTSPGTNTAKLLFLEG